MARKKKKLHAATCIVIAVLILILAVGAGYIYKYENELFMYLYNSLFVDNNEKKDVGTPTVIEGDLSIHFMELGNEWSGDCIYIKAGDTDILVDAGSRAGSVSTIKTYVDNYVTDGILEFVIVTHADRDHIAGFAASNSLFDVYECKTIIDFPRTDKTTKTYNDYVANRNAEVEAGATHYNALQCYNNENGAQRVWQLSDDVTMTILYQRIL